MSRPKGFCQLPVSSVRGVVLQDDQDDFPPRDREAEERERRKWEEAA